MRRPLIATLGIKRIGMSTDGRKRLIFGLLYPAVLGTALVTLAIRTYSHHSIADPHFVERVAAALIASTFFCASYNASDKGNCNIRADLLDAIEVALMFVCFAALGMLSTDNEAPNILLAYPTLAVVIWLQVLWRKLVGLDAFALLELRIYLTLLVLSCAYSRPTGGLAIAAAGGSAFLVFLYVFRPSWYVNKY